MMSTVLSPFNPANYFVLFKSPRNVCDVFKNNKKPSSTFANENEQERDENKAGSNMYLFTVLQMFSLTKYR